MNLGSWALWALGLGGHSTLGPCETKVLPPVLPSIAEPIELRERFEGALLGLATGDALGAPVEFALRGTFAPVSEMQAGGPFLLEKGQWTDDTSQALCLAESLLTQNGFDPQDQMQRYVRWWKTGHLSSTGHCFDIGTTTRSSLQLFQDAGIEFAGTVLNTGAASNGSLMRVLPIPLFYRDDPDRAIELAGESSRTTHGARDSIEAAKFLSGLIIGALQGKSKAEIFRPFYRPGSRPWNEAEFSSRMKAIADGDYKSKDRSQIYVFNDACDTLRAALWAFYNSNSFREGLLLAVNLGGDTDTVGAVYGQLAGAYYGIHSIPTEWLGVLANRALLQQFSHDLFERLTLRK